MGGPDSFDLQLYGSGIYYGGQTIQGQGFITSATSMDNIKSIHIKLAGFSDVHWTERVRVHIVEWCLILYFSTLSEMLSSAYTYITQHYKILGIKNTPQWR